MNTKKLLFLGLLFSSMGDVFSTETPSLQSLLIETMVEKYCGIDEDPESIKKDLKGKLPLSLIKDISLVGTIARQYYQESDPNVVEIDLKQKAIPPQLIMPILKRRFSIQTQLDKGFLKHSLDATKRSMSVHTGKLYIMSLMGLKNIQNIKVPSSLNIPQKCGLTTLKDYTFTKLDNIKYLYINRDRGTPEKCKISFIQPNAFHGLNNLEFLSVSNNRVSMLPPKLMKNLTQLKDVHFSQNNIDKIPKDFFIGLRNVKHVNFSFNKIRSLPHNLFKDLTKLKVIDFTKNEIENLPEQIFDNLINLMRIELQYNKIKNISENIFRNLVNLKTVNLNNNALETLPKNIFKGLSKLEEIDLSNNNLTNLPDGIFDGLGGANYGLYVRLQGNNFSEEEKSKVKQQLPKKCKVFF